MIANYSNIYNKLKMAAKDVLEREAFNKALKDVCPLFNIVCLYKKQQDALFNFLCGRDTFVNLPTGYGKSVIFQMAPLVASRLSNFSDESIIIVISPLVALMKDQVSYLSKINVPAAFVIADQDKNVLKDIENGKYSIVYGSPESMLSIDRWRKMLSSDVYQSRLIGIAVDEAHCVSNW
jgi:superfamily II DNA helicase RecQ